MIRKKKKKYMTNDHFPKKNRCSIINDMAPMPLVMPIVVDLQNIWPNI